MAVRHKQKVRALVDLRLDDLLIDRDAQILEHIKKTVRSAIANPSQRPQPHTAHSLYRRYRVRGFPLSMANGNKLPAWRYLSPWMKVQLATLVLAEHEFFQFRLHLGSELRDRWVQDSKDTKTEIRNRISSHLKRRFGPNAPDFFFVVEAHDSYGGDVRPHLHGSIRAVRMPIPTIGPGSRRLGRLGLADIKAAETLVGRDLIRAALRAAGLGTQVTASHGQGIAAVWLKSPQQSLFNTAWVDYAFRNMNRISHQLGEGRLALPHGLRRQAQELWHLIRDGN